ncbi:hypothetical protein BJ508DRAFT_330068 [Ascobolus immersus RN42]|uniref:Uncharacterized protein n=1 Tax=Ascobolus immersus RN42 TaxID=1160509 RepID=A0A3N4HUM5_ASCIM|nr:hypothetical protein BJ508DRAFT_330068 [Ascobolus immersus RN42]
MSTAPTQGTNTRTKGITTTDILNTVNAINSQTIDIMMTTMSSTMSTAQIESINACTDGMTTTELINTSIAISSQNLKMAMTTMSSTVSTERTQTALFPDFLRLGLSTTQSTNTCTNGLTVTDSLNSIIAINSQVITIMNLLDILNALEAEKLHASSSNDPLCRLLYQQLESDINAHWQIAIEKGWADRDRKGMGSFL